MFLEEETNIKLDKLYSVLKKFKRRKVSAPFCLFVIIIPWILYCLEILLVRYSSPEQ